MVFTGSVVFCIDTWHSSFFVRFNNALENARGTKWELESVELLELVSWGGRWLPRTRSQKSPNACSPSKNNRTSGTIPSGGTDQKVRTLRLVIRRVICVPGIPPRRGAFKLCEHITAFPKARTRVFKFIFVANSGLSFCCINTVLSDSHNQIFIRFFHLFRLFPLFCAFVKSLCRGPFDPFWRE